jgi:hypothetical protein
MADPEKTTRETPAEPPPLPHRALPPMPKARVKKKSRKRGRK